jgi:hypothetical protein
MVNFLLEHCKPYFTTYKTSNYWKHEWKKCKNLLYKTKETWQKHEINMEETCNKYERNLQATCNKPIWNMTKTWSKHIFEATKIWNLPNENKIDRNKNIALRTILKSSSIH